MPKPFMYNGTYVRKKWFCLKTCNMINFVELQLVNFERLGMQFIKES